MAVPPAQVPNLLCRDYFGDPTNDPFNGDRATIVDPYNVSETLPATPLNVRALACDAKGQVVFTAFVLLHNDDSKSYACAHFDKFSP